MRLGVWLKLPVRTYPLANSASLIIWWSGPTLHGVFCRARRAPSFARRDGCGRPSPHSPLFSLIQPSSLFLAKGTGLAIAVGLRSPISPLALPPSPPPLLP